jgi:hypothetical protein|tara:strand:- start:222 stop:374 length:153 start_codon:yes stop_codon:yes gene_type:complete
MDRNNHKNGRNAAQQGILSFAERAAKDDVFLLIDCSIKIQHIRQTSIAKG